MISDEFPVVLLIKLKKKVGVGQAINIGLRQASGEIIAFDLNNDELFPATWLRTLVNELQSSSEKIIVGGTRLIYNSKGIVDSAGVKRNLFGQETQIDAGQKITLLKERKQVDYVGCPVFYKSLLNDIELYRHTTEYCDETYVFYFEDTEFCELAKLLGYKTYNIYPAISYHRRSATVTTISAKAYYYLKRGRIRFMIKYFSPFRLLLGSLWWFSTAIFDSVYYSSVMQAFMRRSGLQKTDWEPRTKVVAEAIYWNLRNLKDHFNARKVCLQIKTNRH
jgi:GT2 family glycosyltransferase